MSGFEVSNGEFQTLIFETMDLTNLLSIPLFIYFETEGGLDPKATLKLK